MSAARAVAVAGLLGGSAWLAAGCGGGRSTATAVDVVRVTIDGCGLAPEIATGFSSGGGVIVTAAHPLGGTGPITVDGQAATPVVVDVRADVAILAVGTPTAALPDFRLPRTGERVHVLVFRDAQRTSVDATVQGVSSLHFQDLVTHLDVVRAGASVDYSAVGGDSGAPVVGRDGQVVGLVFATLRDVGTNTSWVVSSSEIRTALAARGTAPSVVRPPC